MFSRTQASLKRACLFPIIGLLAITALASQTTQNEVRYLKFAEVADTIRLFVGSGLPGSEIADDAAWDLWIREQDNQVRSRIDRGVEDSISNLILYGASYTNLPRLEGWEKSITDSGALSAAAHARVHALAVALNARPQSKGERVRFVQEFLQQRTIAEEGVEPFLTANLKRFANEQRAYQQKLDQAAKSSDQMEVLFARGTLYQQRGLSVDTSLLPNYALEDTLRSLANKGVVAPRKIRRIAVIGPGLDFADKRDGYDFYPLQTIQPFAVLEGALRQGLANAADVRVVTLDLNPAVNSHIAKLAKEAAAGRTYTVQLPRDAGGDWAPAANAYWEHFGEIIGTHVKPLTVPLGLNGVSLRAIAIASRYASRIAPLDLNIVAQTLDLAEGQRFDLVVATNVLVYYDSFQQAIALASIARLMNPSGIFLCNTVLPAQHDSRLEFLGRRSVAYSSTGSYGDDIVVYRRK